MGAALLFSATSSALAQQGVDSQSGVEPASAEVEAPPNREPIPTGKMLRYAKRVIAKYDEDGDGALHAKEWRPMRGRPATIDTDRDGWLTAEEFAGHIARYAQFRQILLLSPQDAKEPNAEGGHPPLASPQGETAAARPDKKYYVRKSRLPSGLPQSFIDRDRDGDAQLTREEFAPDGNVELAKRFRDLDANLDGIVTAQEFLKGAPPKIPAVAPATEPTPQP